MTQPDRSPSGRAALKTGVLASLLLVPCAVQAASVPPEQILSTLTDGTFPRQLELPNSDTLAQGSPLLNEALERFKTYPFDVGERIRYVITYLGVPAGLAEIVMRRPIRVGSGWAIRATGEVRNAEWYGWMVKLHDSIEAIFQPNAEMNPVRFYINQQEPVSFRQTSLMFFDTKENKVRLERKRKENPAKSDELPLEPNAKDAVGALYYFRTHVKPGDGKKEPIRIPIFTSDKNWIGTAKHVREETIKVLGHTYETDVYQLKTQLGQILQQKGDIKLWVTRDSRRLPVYIEADVKFGYIKLSLQEWDQGFPDPKAKTAYPPIRAK